MKWLLGTTFFLLLFWVAEKLSARTYTAKRPLYLDLDAIRACRALIRIMDGIVHQSLSHWIVAVIFTAVTVLLYIGFMKKRSLSMLWESFVLFVLPSSCIVLLMISLEWVRLNLYQPRYLYLAILLWVINFSFLLEPYFSARCASFHLRKWLVTVILLGVAAGLLFKFSVTRPMSITQRIIIKNNLESATDLGKSLDGVVGSGMYFWKVWPLVWSVNASGHKDFLGVSDRSEAIRPLFQRQLKMRKTLRLMAWHEDTGIARTLDTYVNACIVHRDARGTIVVVDVK